jgi:hypothetical protein
MTERRALVLVSTLYNSTLSRPPLNEVIKWLKFNPINFWHQNLFVMIIIFLEKNFDLHSILRDFEFHKIYDWWWKDQSQNLWDKLNYYNCLKEIVIHFLKKNSDFETTLVDILRWFVESIFIWTIFLLQVK